MKEIKKQDDSVCLVQYQRMQQRYEQLIETYRKEGPWFCWIYCKFFHWLIRRTIRSMERRGVRPAVFFAEVFECRNCGAYHPLQYHGPCDQFGKYFTDLEEACEMLEMPVVENYHLR